MLELPFEIPTAYWLPRTACCARGQYARSESASFFFLSRSQLIVASVLNHGLRCPSATTASRRHGQVPPPARRWLRTSKRAASNNVLQIGGEASRSPPDGPGRDVFHGVLMPGMTFDPWKAALRDMTQPWIALFRPKAILELRPFTNNDGCKGQ